MQLFGGLAYRPPYLSKVGYGAGDRTQHPRFFAWEDDSTFESMFRKLIDGLELFYKG
jgi:hypothetical protein